MTDPAENPSLEGQLGTMHTQTIERTPPDRRSPQLQLFAKIEQSHVPHIADVDDLAPDFTLRQPTAAKSSHSLSN